MTTERIVLNYRDYEALPADGRRCEIDASAQISKRGIEGGSLAVRGAGSTPINPPPFPDLGLIPASLWV